MILPIYTYGQPVLRLTASDGVGLAAPQVGLAIRLAVIDLDVISDDEPQYKDFRRAYINPKIVEADSSETEVMEEGCLSFPGIHEPVRRPKRIRVTYLDEQFQPHDEWVDGLKQWSRDTCVAATRSKWPTSNSCFPPCVRRC